MKKLLVILCSAACISQAAVVHFDLSPPGSDAAVGLSPLNEVPAATNSTGSGNALAIIYDTESRVLSFGIGYGSAAGFTDLTAPATVLHIHGPAAAGESAPPVVNLEPFHFPAPNPALGGVIFGAFEVPTNLVENLLAGLNYINVHTTNYPAGEIRGQLIPRPTPNRPPKVVCPPHCLLECEGKPTTLTVKVSDLDSDPLRVVWNVNGAPMQTNQVEPGKRGTAGVVKFTAEFPLGTNVVQVVVTDGTGNRVACETLVRVTDRRPPVIVSATASPNVLWPPNHKMVDVCLRAQIKEQCGDARWKIISVTSSEPFNGLGDGDTSPDWEIVDNHNVRLRAERSGRGPGRIYTIKIQARDEVGNLSAPHSVYVVVPKSQGKDKYDDKDDDWNDDKGNDKGNNSSKGNGMGKG